MPVPIAAVHIELVEINKEEVVFQKAAPALLTALHVIVVLEDVVVDQQGIAYGNRTLITQWKCYDLPLSV